MSDRFLNLMRQQASSVSNGTSQTVLGTVIAYDPVNYYANVQIYPADPTDPTSEPMTTGMIPIFSPWVGANYGLFTPPSIGQVVCVEFQEGNVNNCFILGGTWTLQSPPQPVPSGECWLVHSTGSFIKMTNDGSISILSNKVGTFNPTITVNCQTANITAAVSANVTAPAINLSGVVEMGNLSSSLTGLMNNVAIAVYNGHTHNQQGGGVTQSPNQPLDSTALTTNVTAN